MAKPDPEKNDRPKAAGIDRLQDSGPLLAPPAIVRSLSTSAEKIKRKVRFSAWVGGTATIFGAQRLYSAIDNFAASVRRQE